MRIIPDEQKLINIHPLVIYFRLTPDLYAKYSDKLLRLNKHKEFTRGIFKFQTLMQTDEYNEALPMSLTYALKISNMMVRLVDDASGKFYYALHKVDFRSDCNDSTDEFQNRCMEEERSMQLFIQRVCEENIQHLYNHRAPESTDMISAFTDAAYPRNLRSGIWEKISDDSKPVRPTAYSAYNSEAALMNGENDSLLHGTLNPEFLQGVISTKTYKYAEKLLGKGFSNAQAKQAAEALWEFLVTEFHAPDEKTSNGIAEGINKTKSPFLERDISTRHKPDQEPQVSVEIKEIKHMKKSGKENIVWGVEFRVNGERFPIRFGSKAQGMIYVCTLLRAKIGERMYLHEFYNNGKGRGCRFQRQQSKEWLRKVFYTLYPSMDKDFDKWLAKIDNDRGHTLNQGKSQAAKTVMKALDSQPNGRYYCVIDTESDDNNDSYYNLRINPDHISIADELQDLVAKCYTTMGVGTPPTRS